MSPVPGSTTYVLRQILEDLGPGASIPISALFTAAQKRATALNRNAFDQAIHRLKRSGVIEKRDDGEVFLGAS